MTADDSDRLLAGRYRLGAVIGRGGVGPVLLARHQLPYPGVGGQGIGSAPQPGPARAADGRAVRAPGVLGGSPPSRAPGRPRGGRPGPPADLWALGASLFAAVEGRPPFERDGVLASLTAVVADELDPAPHAGPLR